MARNPLTHTHGDSKLTHGEFDTTQVWAPAWARLEKKILALKFKVNGNKTASGKPRREGPGPQ